jgi:hypothetical protein
MADGFRGLTTSIIYIYINLYIYIVFSLCVLKLMSQILFK